MYFRIAAALSDHGCVCLSRHQPEAGRAHQLNRPQ